MEQLIMYGIVFVLGYCFKRIASIIQNQRHLRKSVIEYLKFCEENKDTKEGQISFVEWTTLRVKNLVSELEQTMKEE